MKDVLLIFDFDDTIVYTNREFDRTNLLTATYVSKAIFGHLEKVNEILKYQNEVDMSMLKMFGLFRPRFLLSWYDTYDYFCKQARVEPSEQTRKEIELLVNDVYLRRFENIPHSIETITKLKEMDYSIIILTAGEEEIQQRRIQQSGIMDHVEAVHVYQHKTPHTLKEVMAMHPAREYVMIGNSLKTDIYPALENDIWAFHLECKTWAADHHDIDRTHRKYVRLNDLSEVPEQLYSLFTVAVV